MELLGYSFKVTAVVCNDRIETKRMGLLFLHEKQQITQENAIFGLQMSCVCVSLDTLDVTLTLEISFCLTCKMIFDSHLH